jgi:hypothetical protein
VSDAPKLTPEQIATIRGLFAAAADSVDALGVGHGGADYAELIGPVAIEGLDLQKAMTRMWSCALTVAGIWRRVSANQGLVIDPLLYTKYVIGQAMSWDVAIAMHKGAWRTSESGELPGKGDSVIVGPGGYHILTIATDVNDAAFFDTVEGGQADAGGMCIKRLSRRLIRSNGALYCGHDPSPGTKVYGWSSCVALIPPFVVAGDNTAPGPAITGESAPTSPGGTQPA